MSKIQFYPLDVTYKVKDNRPHILIFGRAVDGKTITVIDDSFMPYFWAILKKGEDSSRFRKSIEGLSEKQDDGILKIIDTQIQKKNYIGEDEEAIKIIVNQPKAVVHFRDIISARHDVELVLESDIRFAKRYMIDRGIVPATLYEVSGEQVAEKVKTDYIMKAESINQISDDSINPKILAFDIETYNPAGKGIAADKYPIIMVSLYGKDMKKVITWKKFETRHDYIEFVDGEAELITAFKTTVEEYMPDIIVGYYSDGFDFPYIIERAE
ncbi:MAG: hypothetical protein NT001_04630, partial [Candidatus Woesearchaeota archaeon]|nr:hypothetical protein [Candidatus Woesearchaeota archaeon]